MEEEDLMEVTSVGLESMECLVRHLAQKQQQENYSSNPPHPMDVDCCAIGDVGVNKFKKVVSLLSRMRHAWFRRGASVNPCRPSLVSLQNFSDPHGRSFGNKSSSPDNNADTTNANGINSNAVFCPLAQHPLLPQPQSQSQSHLPFIKRNLREPVAYFSMNSSKPVAADFSMNSFKPVAIYFSMNSSKLGSSISQDRSQDLTFEGLTGAGPIQLKSMQDLTFKGFTSTGSKPIPDFSMALNNHVATADSYGHRKDSLSSPPLSNTNSFLSSITGNGSIVSTNKRSSMLSASLPPTKKKCHGDSDDANGGKPCGPSGRCHCSKRRISQVKKNHQSLSNQMVDIPADEYSWRKYGQKPIKGSLHPRKTSPS